MRLFILACAAILTMAGSPRAQTPRVVADIPPVHALVAAVMGDIGTPALLLDAASDPHHMQLRPSQARALASTDLLVWMGPVLTPWLVDVRTVLAPDALSLALLDLPGPPLSIEGAHMAADDHATLDPHAWLDPLTAAFYLPAIADSLGRIDPANAARYSNNASAAAAQLIVLDEELRGRLEPLRPVPLIAYHDALRYFLTRYGLTLVGHVTDSTGTAPGAAGLRALRDGVSTSTRVKCVLIEPGQDTALINGILPRSEYRLAEIDTLGTTLPPGPELYEAMLRGIAEALTACTAS